MNAILSIPSLARECQTGLLDLANAVQHAEDDIQGRLNPNEVEDIQDRYQQWTKNLSAIKHPGHAASLEYRVRGNPLVRDAIVRILSDLKRSVRTAIEIAKYDRVNRQERRQADVINPAEFGFSSDSDSDVSSTSDLNVNHASSSISEIEEVIFSIKDRLSSLFRAAAFIRKQNPESRRYRAQQTKAFIGVPDKMYILDRFSKLRANASTTDPTEKDLNADKASMVARLAEANARRRQYFKYCRDHIDRAGSTKSQNELDYDMAVRSENFHANSDPKIQQIVITKSEVSSASKPTILAETEATQLARDVDTGELFLESSTYERAESEVSFATTVAETVQGELRFPPLPPNAFTNEGFLCPYCYKIVVLKTRNKEHMWRKHILEDLKPYICTFPGCAITTFESKSAWFDHELSIHRVIWPCPSCSQVFPSNVKLETHLIHSHQDAISEDQLPVTVAQAKRPQEAISPEECPFCDEEWAAIQGGSISTDEIIVVSMQQFRKHVGLHLEQIALFSLPRLSLDSDAASDVKAARSDDSGPNLQDLEDDINSYGTISISAMEIPPDLTNAMSETEAAEPLKPSSVKDESGEAEDDKWSAIETWDEEDEVRDKAFIDPFYGA